MLTITQVNYIRDLYFLEGKNITEICNLTGRNYRTIKKYIIQDDFNPKEHKVKKPNKSDMLRPIINKWLTEDKFRHHKQRHTAKRIYDRLKEEYPDLLKVSERTVRRIVKEEKEKVYGADNAYLKLEHPGGEAQVDFGCFQSYENSVLRNFHILVLSFPKSNAGFVVATRSETREALLEGLVTIFNFIGYVPNTIWFDQMSSVALRTRDERGVVKPTDFIMRFATHYGFDIKLCNPNSGHEKGNVENKVGTIRRNMFVPEPTIKDLDEFNQKLLEKCLEANKELHYRHKVPIKDLFEEEKSLMIPVNKVAFDTANYENRKVNKYGLVEYSGCRYSVSPKYVGETVVLKIMANKIEILSKDLSTKITEHPRLFERGQESINYIDFIDIIKLRPNALKYSGIYSLLPTSWQDYLKTLDKESYKRAFDILRMILLEEDMDYADKALKETLKHKSTSPEAIEVTYKRLKEDYTLFESTIYFPADLPSYEVDINQYDLLLLGGERR